MFIFQFLKNYSNISKETKPALVVNVHQLKISIPLQRNIQRKVSSSGILWGRSKMQDHTAQKMSPEVRILV